MALVHHQQAVPILYGVAQVVRHHDGSQFLLLYDTVRQFHDGFCCFWIQGGGVLIQDEKLNGGHGGHKKRHGLTLAAGENTYFNIHLILQSKAQGAEAFPVKIHPVFVGSGAQVEEFPLIVCQSHIFSNGHGRTGAHGRILVYPADAALALVFRHPCNVCISDADGTLI